MKTIDDINELNKIIRTHLVSQAEIASNNVRNALTTYGTDLDKLLEEKEYVGIGLTDALILFELRTNDNNADVSMTENDGDITFYKSYLIYVIIYGDDGKNVMNKLIARLRSQRIRQALYEDGVYLEKVTNDVSINEFKNNVMWLRNDFEIHISCQLRITQLSTDNDFESISPINTF